MNLPFIGAVLQPAVQVLEDILTDEIKDAVTDALHPPPMKKILGLRDALESMNDVSAELVAVLNKLNASMEAHAANEVIYAEQRELAEVAWKVQDSLRNLAEKVNAIRKGMKTELPTIVEKIDGYHIYRSLVVQNLERTNWTLTCEDHATVQKIVQSATHNHEKIKKVTEEYRKYLADNYTLDELVSEE